MAMLMEVNPSYRTNGLRSKMKRIYVETTATAVLVNRLFMRMEETKARLILIDSKVQKKKDGMTM